MQADRTWIFEEFQQQRTRNVVRQIANQLDAAMREKNAWIELQRISVDDFKPLIPEARMQKVCKSRILFDRENVRTFFEKEPGQRAQPGPDFDHKIFRSDLCLIDNPASEILIVEKILAESLYRRHADFLQRCPYLGKLHSHGARPIRQQGKFLGLFTKFCEQNT